MCFSLCVAQLHLSGPVKVVLTIILAFTVEILGQIDPWFHFKVDSEF